jgi:hypothetical protein
MQGAERDFNSFFHFNVNLFEKVSISPFSSGECLLEFLFQRGAGVGDLGEEFFVFGQQVIEIAGAGVGVVRVGWNMSDLLGAGMTLGMWRFVSDWRHHATRRRRAEAFSPVCGKI